ncbi:hypothetical protein A4X13_0g5176 [Tilletia indica]|uniref:Palmitoyltransferase n=1 Tax=Tilletia indica TaxID=43049 RepID=A0A177TE94_9BASI|nr:hypothetical protein A4X13_0g5176 [Tilletia indica]
MSVRSAQADLEAPPPASQQPQQDEQEAASKKDKKPRPDPPQCVKGLQRCAARLDEWERKQASLAREREHIVSPPDKPEPFVNRYVTVPIVAIILTWVAIVYLWRIIYPALAGRSNSLATKEQGIGLCVGFCVLWSMTIWSWIKAVLTQPGYAKDFLPQCDPPPPPQNHPAFDPTRSEQEPILYDGPIEGPADSPGAEASGGVQSNLPKGSEEDAPAPPGILSAALPIASARKESHEQPFLSTSARSGAGTDTTAVSRSGGAYLGKSPHDSMFDKDGIQEPMPHGVPSFSSPQPSRRTRSASIASSVTGLPPSPKPDTDIPLSMAEGEGTDGKPVGQHTMSPEFPRESDDSYTMPGGLPPNAREYDWERHEPPHMSFQDAVNLGPPSDRQAAFPTPASGPSNFLPIPQRYPTVVPLLAPVEDATWRYCHWCKVVKPPRAHHCKKCGACVLKMDHHCPWVGGCVGALNYRFFLIFVMWVCALEIFVLVSNAVLFARGMKRRGVNVPSEMRWGIDGFMISLFPICAIFGIFTLTLLSVHLYLLTKNLSTIEQLAWSSRSSGEDAVLDGWMRQPLETRRKALDDFDRAGGWIVLVRSRNRSRQNKASLLPAPATTSSEEERKEVAKLKKKAEDMLLMKSDYVSCGLFLPHKAFLRETFLDGGPWGDDRTEGNPWWLGGRAEHGPQWEKLIQLYEERDAAVGTTRRAEAYNGRRTGELCSKEGGSRDRDGSVGREKEISRLQRRIRGRPNVLGVQVGAALENARQVFGDRPWEWFLPVGKAAHDGLSYPLNPRFRSNGARRPREQWPEPLQ